MIGTIFGSGQLMNIIKGMLKLNQKNFWGKIESILVAKFPADIRNILSAVSKNKGIGAMSKDVGFLLKFDCSQKSFYNFCYSNFKIKDFYKQYNSEEIFRGSVLWRPRWFLGNIKRGEIAYISFLGNNNYWLRGNVYLDKRDEGICIVYIDGFYGKRFDDLSQYKK